MSPQSFPARFTSKPQLTTQRKRPYVFRLPGRIVEIPFVRPVCGNCRYSAAINCVVPDRFSASEPLGAAPRAFSVIHAFIFPRPPHQRQPPTRFTFHTHL